MVYDNPIIVTIIIVNALFYAGIIDKEGNKKRSDGL
jgi:hypothetical protein